MKKQRLSDTALAARFYGNAKPHFFIKDGLWEFYLTYKPMHGSKKRERAEKYRDKLNNLREGKE